MGGFVLREDIVGCAGLLSVTPQNFCPDAIVSLMRARPTEEKGMLKEMVGLGLSAEEAMLLIQHFHAIVRPYQGRSIGGCSMDQADQRLAFFGLYLLLQLLSESVSSTVSHRKSDLSETWPSPRGPHSPHSPHMPKSPHHQTHAHPHALANTRNVVSDITHERNTSSTPATLTSRGSLPFFGYQSEKGATVGTSEDERSPPSSPAALPPASPNRSHLGAHAGLPVAKDLHHQWAHTPRRSHMFAPHVQIQFLLANAANIVRICVAASTSEAGPPSSSFRMASKTGSSSSSPSSSPPSKSVVDGRVVCGPIDFLVRCEEHDASVINYRHPDVLPFEGRRTQFDLVSSLSFLLKDIASSPSSLSRRDHVHHDHVHGRTVVHDHTLTEKHYLLCTHSFRSHLYAAAAVAHCAIVHTSNSTVFVGAVGGALIIRDCSSLIVVAACHSVHVSNCKDVTLHLYTSTPPVLAGNNQGVQLAPFNAHYPGHAEHVSAAGLDDPLAENCWDQPVNGLLRKLPLESSGSSVMRLPPHLLHPFAVPSVAVSPAAAQAKERSFPLPADYAAAVQVKRVALGRARERLRSAQNQLTAEAAIFGKFKEWLSSSGNARQIEELVAQDMRESRLG